MDEKAEVRAKIPKDFIIILRITRINKRNGAYSKITEKGLREYFENHKRS